MTERERWIVYPLLFLALGAALRDKLIDRTLSKSIVCQELTVLADDPSGRGPTRVLARIGPAEGSYFVEGLTVGTISAKNYLYHGVHFVPNVLRAVPGLSPTDWLRALQQSTRSRQPDAGGQNRRQPAPSDESPSSADGAD